MEVFRLGTPGVYAGTAYGICHWADSKASDEAKAMISNLLQPKQYDRHAVGSTIIWMFAGLYPASAELERVRKVGAVYNLYDRDFSSGKENSILYNIMPPSQQPQSQQSQTVTPLIKNKKTGRCGGCAGCASCGASPSATSKGPTGACCSSWGSCRDC